MWWSKPDSLTDKIRLLKKAIGRKEKGLDSMTKEWEDSGGICCPGCMFGSQWQEVVDKLERQDAWLKILLEKRAKQSRS